MPAEPQPVDPRQVELLEQCIATFQTWLYLPDPGALLVTLAAEVGNRMPGDPLWLVLVGSASTGKTEVVGALNALQHVRQASVLTEASLLSGTPKKEVEKGSKGGLLREIGSFGVLLVKDFTSVLSMPRDPRSQVLAALREVYDGSWTRYVGTGGGTTLHWSGKMGLIAGCTPAIDDHHAVMGAMGERFALYRINVSEPEEQAQRALKHLGHEATMRQELGDAVVEVLANVIPDELPPLDQAVADRLVQLAVFTVRVRTAVSRDGYDREVTRLPEPEAPSRLAKMLHRLFVGLQAIGVDEAETWRLVTKTANDCVPGVRRTMLPLLGETPVSTSELTELSGLPTTTTHRTLEDLALLGVVLRTKASTAKTAANLWKLSDWSVKRLPSFSREVSSTLITTPEHFLTNFSGLAQRQPCAECTKPTERTGDDGQPRHLDCEALF